MADNLKTIKCPACQKEMVKVFVPSAGVNIDICLNGCGGMYFDNRELSYFDEQLENIDAITKAIEGKTFEPVDETQLRVCPVCGANMVKNNIGVNTRVIVEATSIDAENMIDSDDVDKVIIDECYSCGGKFLDLGELQKIRNQYATDKQRTEALMNVVHKLVGEELDELDEKWAEIEESRSFMKKFFDKLMEIKF